MKKGFKLVICLVMAIGLFGCQKKATVESKFNKGYQDCINDNEEYEFYSSKYYGIDHLAGIYTCELKDGNESYLILTSQDNNQLNSAWFKIDTVIKNLDECTLETLDNDSFKLVVNDEQTYRILISSIEDNLLTISCEKE